MGNYDTLGLARLIRKNIKANFAIKHFSGNLMDTVNIWASKSGYVVRIPAKMYHIGTFKHEGVLKFIGGSYASKVAFTGGFSKFHKDYDINAINDAIYAWAAINHLQIEIMEK